MLITARLITTGLITAELVIAAPVTAAPVTAVQLALRPVRPAAAVPAYPAAEAIEPQPQWGWPTPRPREIARGFDPPARRWLPGHRGVDLLTRPAEVVRAPADGTVRFAGRVAGRGVLSIDHGPLRSTYEPIEPVVRAGATVVAGQVIGTVSAGRGHCGSRTCLHWGLRHGSEYLDPLALLPGQRARLLPVWDVPPLRRASR